ncbi:MAG: hydroxymethylglutaryl-CoA lyase [Chromatocurvus sp.]
MTAIDRQVSIVEVGARDGLQNEQAPVALATRLALIDDLAASGIRTIEAGSFVNPAAIPQMADSDALFAALRRAPGVTYTALTPNVRGLERAIAARVDEVAVFAAASESFSQRNIRCSIAESLQRFEPVLAQAATAGIPVRGYVSCVLGCPYEGSISPEAVGQVTRALLSMGCYEVSLGDTIGVGTPGSMQALLDVLLADTPVDRLAVHCHDTYGQALANILIALQRGLRRIDSAVAGLGGCPFAPGATGNVATEDVVYMLHGMGFDTGIDLDRLIDAGNSISAALARENASRVATARTRRLNVQPPRHTATS